MKKMALRFQFSIVVCLFFYFIANGYGQQILQGHVPDAISNLGLQPISRLDSTKYLYLTIGLPLRNQQGLTTLLQQMYDSASPNFRQYLTTEQFTEQFGPSQQDYQAVIDFVNANGLTVTGTHVNRVLVDVSGAVSDIEKAFHVKMNVYQHPTESRTFFAPDAEPTVPSGLTIIDISGLNNYALTRSALHSPSSNKNKYTVQTGSAAGGDYWGHDFRAAYMPGPPNDTRTGTGQIVGIVAFDGYNATDISGYENSVVPPLSAVTLQNVLVDGFNGISRGEHSREITVDIEMAISMAPGLSKVIVYEASPDSIDSSHGGICHVGWHDLLDTIANDNVAKQISCSFQIGAKDTCDVVADQIFQQMAVQGQSFFVASGDYSSYRVGNPCPFPQGSDYVTDVGGTVLSMNGKGSSYGSETAWGDGGGGWSTKNPIPSYQQGLNGINGASTTWRNIPDVAMIASPYMVFYYGGGLDSTDGTSFSAPLWAGFTALINQQAADSGKPSVGFLNPVLYYMGSGAFHDITAGSNGYSAGPGYDLCTGWGSPIGQQTISDIITLDNFNATVDQKLQGGSTSVDSVARWQSTRFNTYPAGTSFQFYLGRNEILRGAQKTISAQKYNNWSISGTVQSDVTNHHLFNIQTKSNNSFVSNLVPTNNATVQAQFIEGGSPGGYVNFKDPWRIDTTDQYGRRNQGMSDWARPVNYSSNNVGLSSPDSGAFLNQNPNFLPGVPTYSVSAPATQSITANGKAYTGIFEYWSGTSATIDSATNLSTPVVFTNAGATVAAYYKGIHLSNDASAFANNSQRKFVTTKVGNTTFLHQVYTSAGHVWYEYSTNGGATWNLGQNGLATGPYGPLDGTAGGKCPSIDWDSLTNHVVIVWQQAATTPYTYTIQYMTFWPDNYLANSYSLNSYGTLYTDGSDAYSSVNANPNIAVGSNEVWLLTFEKQKAYSTGNGTVSPGVNILWGTFPGGNPLNINNPSNIPTVISGTNASSCYATIYGNKANNYSSNGNFNGDCIFPVAWQQGSWPQCQIKHSELYFKGNPLVEAYQSAVTQLSQSTVVANYQPSTIGLLTSSSDSNYYAISWLLDYTGYGNPSSVKLCYKNGGSSTLYTYGYDPQSCSINLSNNNSGSYFVWSQVSSGTWSNEVVSAANLGSTETLGSTGQNVQLSNGAGKSNMYETSFYPFTAPYYFSTPIGLGNVTGLQNTAPAQPSNKSQDVLQTIIAAQTFNSRGVVLGSDSAQLLYLFGDIMVDGNNVPFVTIPDTFKSKKISDVNTLLETQPFSLKSNSKVTFVDFTVAADSEAVFALLGDTGYVSFNVELLNASTNKVLGTIKQARFDSSSLSKYSQAAYNLNTRGISGSNLKIIITASTNISNPIAIPVDDYATENIATDASIQSLTMQQLNLITTYALAQNYPNPFNPTTTITYDLPANGLVTLNVYDVLGRKVETLVSGRQNAGNHSVAFDGSHLTSGVYFYRVNITGNDGKNFVSTKKMLLMK